MTTRTWILALPVHGLTRNFLAVKSDYKDGEEVQQGPFLILLLWLYWAEVKKSYRLPLAKRMHSEKELLFRARSLDQTSLAEIYQRYRSGLYRYAMRLLCDHDLAEDCVAETFSRLIDSLKNGGGPDEHLQAYLYKIAHNWINDHYRRGESSVAEVSSKLGGNPRETSRVVQERLEIDKVRKALAFLPLEQREVMLLKYLENRSNQEIAQALGKSVGAVRVLHHRGVARLRSLLAEEGMKPGRSK